MEDTLIVEIRGLGDGYTCDEPGCNEFVPVDDPYGTVALVLCASHSGSGSPIAGPVIHEFPEF